MMLPAENLIGTPGFIWITLDYLHSTLEIEYPYTCFILLRYFNSLIVLELLHVSSDVYIFIFHFFLKCRAV